MRQTRLVRPQIVHRSTINLCEGQVIVVGWLRLTSIDSQYREVMVGEIVPIYMIAIYEMKNVVSQSWWVMNSQK